MAERYSVVRMAQRGLEMTAEASGGFAVTNTDDFTSGLERIVEDLDDYDLLGFYPADSKGKGYRSLDVKIAGHPDWKLRYRRGYVPGGPPAAPKTTDPLVALSTGTLPATDPHCGSPRFRFPAARGRRASCLRLKSRRCARRWAAARRRRPAKRPS